MGIYHYPEVSTTLFGGTGKDGVFNPQSDYNFDDAEGSWIIKHYSAINIPAGVKVSTVNRIKGVILYCSGNVTINGEIDLDGKGYGSEQAPPIVFDIYKAANGVWKRAWIEYCTTFKCGDGGGQGGGGSSYYSYPGGNGAHAGGAGYVQNTPSHASGWSPGSYSGGWWVVRGGSLLCGGIAYACSCGTSSGAGSPGGAGYLGTPNAGGNAGGLFCVVAKGTIVLGSTANIHCDGQSSPDASSDTGCNGGAGGGGIALLSQDPQSIDGSATLTVAGGSGGINSGYGGNGGNGDVGTIITQQVA